MYKDYLYLGPNLYQTLTKYMTISQQNSWVFQSIVRADVNICYEYVFKDA